jgi:pentatricopeptide repeat protein
LFLYLPAAGQVATASQVLAGLHSSNKSGMVAPTHLMISLYSKCCDWRTAYQLYGKLLASGVRPDTQTLAVLIEALWQAGTVPTSTTAMLAFEDLCRMGLLR